jgi:hypothetical protein
MDTGADISLIRSATTEFEPINKVRVKDVVGSVIKTYGTIRANIMEENFKFPF